MKRLTLIRHAKSSWKDSAVDDFDRPLNKRGERDAPEMGRRLAAAGFAPDLIVTSPARRAAETAREIARRIDYPKDAIRLEEDLYLASAGKLLDFVQALDDALSEVALVGHNPGLTELCNQLGGLRIDNLPTAGVVQLELDARSWSEAGARGARLLLFDSPKPAGD